MKKKIVKCCIHIIIHISFHKSVVNFEGLCTIMIQKVYNVGKIKCTCIWIYIPVKVWFVFVWLPQKAVLHSAALLRCVRWNTQFWQNHNSKGTLFHLSGSPTLYLIAPFCLTIRVWIVVLSQLITLSMAHKMWVPVLL